MKFFVTKIESDNDTCTIHKSICEYLPSDSNRIELGEFYSCSDALDEAKKNHDRSNGCFHCCLLSHSKII